LDWLDAANISHAITERVARGDIDMSGLSEIAFEDNLEGDLGEDSELDSDEDSTEV